jgi:peptide/nickel transport system substrate-binding protein
MQKKTKTWGAVAVVVVIAAVAIGIGVSGGSNPSSTVANKTLTIAEGANASPNYILPFYPPSACTVTNTSQFEQMMFRPLYWFGLAGSASLAAATLSREPARVQQEQHDGDRHD